MNDSRTRTSDRRQRDAQRANAVPKQGENLTATDIKERLLQDADAATVLLWPPNLFAFTSYVLNLSGAYQLVVSPPPGDDAEIYHWPPKRKLLERLFKQASGFEPHNSMLGLDFVEELNFAEYVISIAGASPQFSKEELWTYLVRSCALAWRTRLEPLTPAMWQIDRQKIPYALSKRETNVAPPRGASQSVPSFLLAC